MDLTQACLDRIAQYDSRVNAFITVTADLAMTQAKVAEAEIAGGYWRGPMHGIPIALKDNIDTAGILTSAASEVFADRVPTEDAAVVKRLRQAGAIILGKLNMGEFAMSESVISYWGMVHNPWSLEYETGASSSGAGAAVSAGFCFAAIGTDTAGSIRMPASHCSVVGLKPTYGLVDTHGTIPLMPSMDHIGPLTRTVEDAAIVLSVIASPDALQQKVSGAAPESYAGSFNRPIDTYRVGAACIPFLEGTEPDILRLFNNAVNTIKMMVGSLQDVQLPTSHVDVMALFAGEAYAFHRPLLKKGNIKYQPTNRHLFDRSKHVSNGWDSAADYFDALQALQAGRQSIRSVFNEIDLIVLPTLRYTARRNDLLLAAIQRGNAVGQQNTRIFDVWGLPAISVPCGFNRQGLPVGLQIVGAPFSETMVIGLASHFEQATGWHLRNPKAFL